MRAYVFFGPDWTTQLVIIMQTWIQCNKGLSRRRTSKREAKRLISTYHFNHLLPREEEEEEEYYYGARSSPYTRRPRCEERRRGACVDYVDFDVLTR